MSRTLLLIAILLVGAFAWYFSHMAPDEAETKPGSCCQTLNPGALVVPADQFVGETSASYAAAKEIPEICCQLFCYCGCDMTEKHTSLLECFISDHSNDCPICRTEVFEALRLKKQGKSVAQIQEWIDRKYEKDYMFDKPSKAFEEYRAKRYLKPKKEPKKVS